MILARAYRVAHGVFVGWERSHIFSDDVVVGAVVVDEGGEGEEGDCGEKCCQCLFQAREHPEITQCVMCCTSHVMYR